MGRTFSPPVSGYGPSYRADADRVTQALWGHFRGAPEPTSVLNNGGTYTDATYVYSDDIDSADVFYQGGHVYDVSETEGDALKAAGYDVYLLRSDFRGVEPHTSMDGFVDRNGVTWHAHGILDTDTATEGNSSLNAAFTAYIDSQGRVRTPETLAASSGGAGYSWTYLDDEPTRVGHDFVFASTQNARSGTPGVATIASAVQSSSPVDIAFESVHVITVGYGVGIFLIDNDPTPLEADALHLFDEYLPADDLTVNHTEMSIDGDLLTVVCPDGFELEVEDPLVSSLWGSTVLFEQLWGPGYPGAEPMSVNAYAVA